MASLCGCRKQVSWPIAEASSRGSFKRVAAGTLRCNAWNGVLQFEAGYGWYTQCDVELEYKADGWEIDILDMGTYEKFNTGTDYVKRKIVDPTTGRPPDGPVKLNGGGQPLPDGAADVFLTFRPYQWVPFGAIFN